MNLESLKNEQTPNHLHTLLLSLQLNKTRLKKQHTHTHTPKPNNRKQTFRVQEKKNNHTT